MKVMIRWSILLPTLVVMTGEAFRPLQSLQRHTGSGCCRRPLFGMTSSTFKKRPVTVDRTTRLYANEECSLDDDEIFECLAEQGYKETNNVLINSVFVAEIESLRNTHTSFEEIGSPSSSNMIKYNKRLRKPKDPFIVNGTSIENDGMNGYTNTNGGSKSNTGRSSFNTHIANLEYNHMVGEDELVLVDIVRTKDTTVSRAFHRAGPRKWLHFNPTTVNAAIVTCGGLCPGLNNVIREITHSLYYLYGVNQVWGVRGGFNGFSSDVDGYEPILLTNEMVENIHHEGGTVLRSSRGGFDIEKILQFLNEYNIQQLYIIGGDGTHRAAYKIHQACMDNKLNVAIAGIPKTIDNDVDYIDRSFGFQSAVEAAQHSIRTAKTEAMCNIPNGVGVIKLMGRSAGFLAAFAALGSGDVDAVLVPEVPIVLDGPKGLLPFIYQRVKEQKYAVIVVAEGAGEELLGASTESRDAAGNKKLPPIGEYIRDKVKEYFLDKGEDMTTVKYIDPSYMVRSVPANAADSLYCLQLAQHVVHGAMAGMTGFSVGMINNRAVYLPIPQLVASSPRSMDPHGMTWERILAMTGQPNTAEPKKKVEKSKHHLVVETETKEETIELPNLPEPSCT